MKIRHTQSGFSLVEVLVAITLLLLVVTGPMTIISKANNSTAFATEQVNAFFLAQEGLELAQKGRDDLLLRYFERQINGTGGLANPLVQFELDYPGCFTATGCGLTINSPAAAATAVVDQPCTSTSCLLYTNTTSGTVRSVYTHTVGITPTPFTRVVKIEKIMFGTKVQEYKVTSTVTWRTGSLIAGQKVELVTYLANVYDTN